MAANKYRAVDPVCSYAIGPVLRLAWKLESQPTEPVAFSQNDVNVDVTEESQNENVIGTKQKGLPVLG